MPNAVEAKPTFMSLPAELRNGIYFLSLAEDDAVRIRYRKRRKRDHDTHSALSSPFTDTWTEPSILKVNKSIRSEASAMYYKSNDLQIRVKMADFEAASAWLRNVVARCGSHPFRHFAFCPCNAAWANLHYLRDLVQLLRETGFQYPQVPAYYEPRDSSIFLFPSGFGWGNLGPSLDEAVELGKKASVEGWSEDWLDVEFGWWVEEKQETGPGAIMRQKLNSKHRIKRERARRRQNIVQGGLDVEVNSA